MGPACMTERSVGPCDCCSTLVFAPCKVAHGVASQSATRRTTLLYNCRTAQGRCVATCEYGLAREGALAEVPISRKPSQEGRRSSVRASRTSQIVASLSCASRKAARDSNASCECSTTALPSQRTTDSSTSSSPLFVAHACHQNSQSLMQFWIQRRRRSHLERMSMSWSMSDKGAAVTTQGELGMSRC